MVNVRRTVELISNVAIILVSGLLGWSYLAHKTLKISSSPSEVHQAVQLEGRTLPQLPSYSWGNHAQTLVLGLRVGCHYCAASLPFYKRLADLEKGNSLHSHILVVMPDVKESGTKELQSAGLTVDSIFNQPLDSIKVELTPTALLVDAHGVVKRAWVGELPPQNEKDLIAAVER